MNQKKTNHTGLPPVELPRDLDQYLATSEARYNDIIPGAEKKIVWAEQAGSQTDLSLVYLHGFSATRQETAPLTEQVAQHFQANVFYTRLTGHGRSSDAMLEADVDNWLADTAEAYAIGKRLGKKVIVIANSTGATLATWLASHATDGCLAANILMAPNFSPRDPMARLLTWPCAKLLVRIVVGKQRYWKPDNERHARYWTNAYPSEALIPMMKLVTLVESLDKSKINTPTQVIYSPKDEVISPSAIEQSFAQLGSTQKELISYLDAEDPRQHILAGDILSPTATQTLNKMICRFVEHAVTENAGDPCS